MKSPLVSLVLHAHLPFVREPGYDRFLEERWLFEAISETYLPLLRMCRDLDESAVPFRFTLSVSPTLGSMLEDKFLRERYGSWLDLQIKLAESECERLRGDPAHPLALMYRDRYLRDRDEYFGLYDGNILSAFYALKLSGRIELTSGAATHAILPLFAEQPECVNAQIETSLLSHRRWFEINPEGIWLPDAAWFPRLEKTLKAYGYQYTFVSARGALFGSPCPEQGVFAPFRAPNGLVFFPLDHVLSRSILDSETGYPAHPEYRDFYRDIGFDLDADYVAPWVSDSSGRTQTGFKYYAVSGPAAEKSYYDPVSGKNRARSHAREFIASCKTRAEKASLHMEGQPLLTIAFDVELFGHFWFEGIDFLDALFREAAAGNDPGLAFVTPKTFLADTVNLPVSVPEASSWAKDGYFEVWLEKSNAWTYRHVLDAGEIMIELAERFQDSVGLKERALNQCARELMLAQCSDWSLMMKTGASASFAKKRIEDSVRNVFRIYEMLSRNSVDTEWITDLEKRDNPFPDLNYRMFRKKK